MKTKITIGAVLLLALLAVAFVPSLTDFNTNQFGTLGNKVSIKSGVLLTNITFPDGSVLNTASGVGSATNAILNNNGKGTNATILGLTGTNLLDISSVKVLTFQPGVPRQYFDQNGTEVAQMLPFSFTVDGGNMTVSNTFYMGSGHPIVVGGDPSIGPQSGANIGTVPGSGNQELSIQNGYIGNVVAVENQNPSGYSVIRFLDNNGIEHGAYGFLNTNAGYEQGSILQEMSWISNNVQYSPAPFTLGQTGPYLDANIMGQHTRIAIDQKGYWSWYNFTNTELGLVPIGDSNLLIRLDRNVPTITGYGMTGTNGVLNLAAGSNGVVGLVISNGQAMFPNNVQGTIVVNQGVNFPISKATVNGSLFVLDANVPVVVTNTTQDPTTIVYATNGVDGLWSPLRTFALQGGATNRTVILNTGFTPMYGAAFTNTVPSNSWLVVSWLTHGNTASTASQSNVWFTTMTTNAINFSQIAGTLDGSKITGTITVTNIIGNGAGLTNLAGTNITSPLISFATANNVFSNNLIFGVTGFYSPDGVRDMAVDGSDAVKIFTQMNWYDQSSGALNSTVVPKNGGLYFTGTNVNFQGGPLTISNASYSVEGRSNAFSFTTPFSGSIPPTAADIGTNRVFLWVSNNIALYTGRYNAANTLQLGQLISFTP